MVYISNSALSIELQMIHQFSQSQTTRALFWLKASTTSPIRFKTLFRHNAKHGKYVKLGRQCIGHKGRELSTRRRPVIVKTDGVSITNFTILGSLAGEALTPRPQHQAHRHQGGSLYNVHGYATTRHHSVDVIYYLHICTHRELRQAHGCRLHQDSI